ncbi:hypothetical protein TNCV_938131 [Trichonephila clavipes]|nr:hypothetical protein TNCV_938131 [Trichonephila clavipes]
MCHVMRESICHRQLRMSPVGVSADESSDKEVEVPACRSVEKLLSDWRYLRNCLPKSPHLFSAFRAPFHYGRCIRDHLNQIFPNRWFARGGPIAWPPRSSYLSPLEFFWGGMNSPVNSEIVLVVRIAIAAATILETLRYFQLRPSIHITLVSCVHICQWP